MYVIRLYEPLSIRGIEKTKKQLISNEEEDKKEKKAKVIAC